ncbi:MAG TPA: 5'-nucleotidase C-terminal domain-containing protein [Gemmatimonadaceae bacterium]|nr:5'-nucleotidase C-terminal domain-containing protein [Gemmatimonadaceae bacterium]
MSCSRFLAAVRRAFTHRATGILLLLAAGCTRAAMPASSPGPSAAPAAAVDLVVAATTDVHGRLRGWDYYADAPDPVRGLTRAATIVDSLRLANPGRVVLVDAGDLLQGNPLTYVAARIAPDSLRPHPVMAAMNAMGYDAAAIGNHEFNYGLPVLQRAMGDARFPLLAANAVTLDERPAFRGWTMLARDGVRVAVVGATTPGSNLWDRDNLRSRVRIGDVVAGVRRAVAQARAAGADVVVAVLHSGLDEPSSYDTAATGVASENVSARVAREVPGIDLIVYGHSHKQMADTVIGSTLLMQPKNWAGSVGVAHLRVVRDAAGGRWRVAGRHSSLVASAGHAESPAVLAATERAHRATVAYVTAPIGETPGAWRADSARVADTPLIDFILEVERRATGAQLASTAAFSLDAALPAGAVTVARLAALYPYDNTLRKIVISGRQLREYLEFSARYFRTAPDGRVSVDPAVPGYNFDIVGGVDYTLDLSRPVGERITTLEYQGRPVAPTDSFTFALNNYRQTGGGGYAMLAGSKNLDDRQLEIRQLLIDEVRQRGTIRPDQYFHQNWRIVPASAVAEVYASMHGLPGERGPVSTAISRSPTPRVPSADPRTPRIRVIGLNDFHGALEPRPDAAGVLRGGAAYVAAAVEQAERECAPPSCQTLFVDAGDELQGTPASNLAYGRPVVAILDHLGLAAAALGNHEFDWGRDTLRARMRQARYAFLGANVRFQDGRDVPWIRDDTLVQRGDTKIGIIGIATTATPATTRASNVTGLRFDEPAPVVDSLARALRARGAGVVIVLAHAGAFCDRSGAVSCEGEIIDLARHLTEPVDAIVSGHTHSLVNTVIRGIPVVQARSSGTAIDVLDIPLDSGVPGEGESLVRHEVRDVRADAVAPDSAVLAMVQRAVAVVAPRVNRPIARIAEDMPKSVATATGETALGDLIADAMRVVGKGDVGVMNNGGIRAPLRAGIATYGSLFEIQPFANVLVRLSVRGRDLRGYLERQVDQHRPGVQVSGVVVVYDTTRPPGSRLVSVRMRNGTPLQDDRTYTVVLNDFMATGGDRLGFGDRALRTEPLDVVDLDALITHLRSLPQPVRPPRGPRLVVTGTP